MANAVGQIVGREKQLGSPKNLTGPVPGVLDLGRMRVGETIIWAQRTLYLAVLGRSTTPKCLRLDIANHNCYCAHQCASQQLLETLQGESSQDRTFSASEVRTGFDGKSPDGA